MSHFVLFEFIAAENHDDRALRMVQNERGQFPPKRSGPARDQYPFSLDVGEIIKVKHRVVFHADILVCPPKKTDS